MPVLPVCLFEPRWVQFSALLPQQPQVAPAHPLGCHRWRIADRVVFWHVIAALVHGSGYERIASPGCSDATIHRRLKAWAADGLSEQATRWPCKRTTRMIGLALDDLAVDGCITKAPGGGEVAGRSPVDRGKQRLKRSLVTDGTGIPLHVVSAGADRHDAPLSGPTLAGLETLDGLPDDVTVHLDHGYDGTPTRALLDALSFDGAIAHKGVPAPMLAGSRWVVERVHGWIEGSQYQWTRKLRLARSVPEIWRVQHVRIAERVRITVGEGCFDQQAATWRPFSDKSVPPICVDMGGTPDAEHRLTREPGSA